MRTETKTQNRQFLNPEHLLRLIPLEPGMVVADFGSGSGHYAVAAATLVGKKGQVFALDVLEDALSQTATLARVVGVYNISTQLCNLEKIGSCRVPDTSCDLVILASLLHQAENKDNVIREAYRVLKTKGRILLVEWRPGTGAFGPPPEQRINKETAQKLLEKYGLRPLAEPAAGSFHYGLLYQK